eukprot:CAMPEP_0178979246 /NCGR_PEP_ID=MMETSP0789-20121207/25717_1 /TAXON_ID=3005 /ORGANISM="Rhizosolenia setigera, Strain CCMP 1694" /LENGTH=582 /DNA_ID=CAMNT_0020669293 /DNA_START=186 /DNA_END=1934 /DNA_ORIENTATION=-
MIQLSSPDQTIWRGNLWSKLKFRIKLDNYFLAEKKHEFSRFVLTAVMQDGVTGQVYPLDSKLYTFTFTNNVHHDQSSKAYIKNDPYNSCILVNIHQDLFPAGRAFNIIIEAEDTTKKDDFIVFGRSQLISITNLAFTVEERFTQKQYVTRFGQRDFAWYSKCGGENAGLDVLISLKNEKGQLVKPTEIIRTYTELIYADGTSTPLMPLSPLRERRSMKPLFRRLRQEPVLGPDNASAPFSFRIEEVSFHHPGQSGFKIKVSAVTNCPIQNVHPGVLNETIIVLSKPKHESKNESKPDNLRAISNRFSKFDEQFKNLVITGDKIPSTVNGPSYTAIPTDNFQSCMLTGDKQKCHFCGEGFQEQVKFWDPDSHKKSCPLLEHLFPFIKFATTRENSDSNKCLVDSTNKSSSSSTGGRRGRRIKTSEDFAKGPRKFDTSYIKKRRFTTSDIPTDLPFLTDTKIVGKKDLQHDIQSMKETTLSVPNTPVTSPFLNCSFHEGRSLEVSPIRSSSCKMVDITTHGSENHSEHHPQKKVKNKFSDPFHPEFVDPFSDCPPFIEVSDDDMHLNSVTFDSLDKIPLSTFSI